MHGTSLFRPLAGVALALACVSHAATASEAGPFGHLIAPTADAAPAAPASAAAQASSGSAEVSFQFALREEGHELLLTDVRVTIDDAATLGRVLAAVSDGPFLVASVPEGRYRVSATHDGRTQVLDLLVEPSAAPLRIALYW